MVLTACSRLVAAPLSSDWSDCDYRATWVMELASTSRPSRVASSRDFPVPREIARRIDSGETPTFDDVQVAVDMPGADARRAFAAL
jgi:hypothetical protein